MEPLLTRNDRVARIAIACLGNICSKAKVPALHRILDLLTKVLRRSTEYLVQPFELMLDSCCSIQKLISGNK